MSASGAVRPGAPADPRPDRRQADDRRAGGVRPGNARPHHVPPEEAKPLPVEPDAVRADSPPAGGPRAEEPRPGEPPRLEQHICFAVQNTSLAFNAVYRHVLRDTGLTYPQYLAMVALWEHGELTVKGLGAVLRLDSGTLSPLLKRLEATGMVSRERSTTDERSIVVRLTPAGEELRGPARRIPAAVEAAAGLDADDLRALRDLLDRLTASLDAAARAWP